jgi:murein DD-endopeptidase MepM/ murein hydrolase activator NlpD
MRTSVTLIGGIALSAFALIVVALAIIDPPREVSAGQTFQTSAPVISPPPTIDGFPRSILIPIKGARTSDIQDTFDQARGAERRHEATDIVAKRGEPVIAVDDGVIQKLFLSKQGGNTIYQFDPTEQFSYYYAHLERYADGLTEGMKVKQGDVIGYVGTSGNAPPDTPHLHFGIFKLGPEKRWWEGTPINPYPILIRAEGRQKPS